MGSGYFIQTVEQVILDSDHMPSRPAPLPVWFHTLLLSLGIGAVYFWLHVPSLKAYSLQLFAALGLGYFVLKLITRKKPRQFLPSTMSLETVMATMAFLLIVGSTGNTTSWFFPLSYVYLFFIAFSSHVITSLVVAFLVLLFHYGLNPDMSQAGLVSLTSLPLVMIFFLYARLQYQDNLEEEQQIKEDQEKIIKMSSTNFRAQNFLQNYLQAKLKQLESLAQHPGNAGLVKNQLGLINLQLADFIEQLEEEQTEAESVETKTESVETKEVELEEIEKIEEKIEEKAGPKG